VPSIVYFPLGFERRRKEKERRGGEEGEEAAAEPWIALILLCVEVGGSKR